MARSADDQGTLLTSSGTMSERNAAALQRVRAAGVLPIVCTGKIPGDWQGSVTALNLRSPMVFLQVTRACCWPPDRCLFRALLTQRCSQLRWYVT